MSIFFFFFKQKTAYEIMPSLVGSEMCIRDRYGNVVYRHTAQNFNPLMATAGRITVVEVEEIVPPGELPPSAIHTPGIYVDRLIVGQFEKRIEQRTLRAGGK